MYNDDYETGMHSGTNKLGGTYVSIPCFPPELPSNVSSIFHALLYYTKDRAQFGNFAVFRILIEELRFLEKTGIELTLPNRKVQVFFKLGLIIADNLGIHGLLGFVESFQGNFACRFCKMDKAQRSLATIEDKAYLRTKTSYQRDLLLNDMSRTGIKEKRAFNRLPNFHVLENLSSDIMHDFLEGTCVFDMAALLNHFINEKKYFSLDQLNSRMIFHDWGLTHSGNIPSQISQKDLKKDNMRMSASEMLSFVHHFGILIGELIPQDDVAWRLYIIIRKITDIVMSPSIQIQCSTILRDLIKEHHLLARNVLQRHLKPKDHFMIHLPTVMENCGPLVNLWCMRFEEKHYESKLLLSNSCCKKNVCLTVAKKQQKKLAFALYGKTLFSNLKIGTSQICTVKDLPISYSKTSKEYQQFQNSKIKILKWVQKNGSFYKPYMILCVEELDSNPVFGIIKFIYMENNNIFFIYNKLTTVFRNHEYAYEVLEITNNDCMTNYDSLVSPYPLSLISSSNKKFVLLRHAL